MSSPAAANSPSKRKHYRLSVSAYDRVSSLLISLLVMVGVTVLALVIIFFARRFVTIPAPIPVLPLDPGDRPSEAALGLKQDIEPPGIEDAPELTEPKLIDTLNALTSELSTKVAILSDEQLDADSEVGRGSGFGDNRTAGDGGGGEEPRREMRFQFADIDNYARWYDYHKIELAVVPRTSNVIYYASNLSQAKPTVREGQRSTENRYLFPTASGPLAALDQRLAEKAGIAGRGSFLVQCYPNEAYLLLLGREQQRAELAGKRITDIQRTVFRVEPKGSGFDFVVEEQVYY